MFKNLYFKQPPERHGMKQDITMAWIDKLPAEPFNELVTQLEAINLINKGPSVFDDFDEANKMLCALYSNWCKKNRLVVITDASKDTRYAGGDRAALFTQRGGGGEDGMDVVLPLLEVWRTPFVRVRQGALQVCHLRARHCQDGDLLRWGV